MTVNGTKKILFLSTSDGSGGSFWCLTELVTQLRKRNEYDIEIASPKNENLCQFCKATGIKYYELEFFPCAITMNKVPGKPFFYRVLSYFYHRLKAVIASRSFKKKIHFEVYDLIYSNNSIIDFGARISRKYHIPHVWHFREFEKEQLNLLYFHHHFSHYVNKHAEKVIMISKALEESWLKRGIDPRISCQIYDGVTKFPYLQSPLQDRRWAINAVVVGTFSLGKRQSLVIDALAMLPKETRDKIHIDFWGDGNKEYIGSLQKKVKREDLQNNVSFKGYSSAVRQELSNYNVGITPSIGEGFGRVTVEYMLAGLCVIASNSGANPELLDNGNSGLLFEKDDFTDLANAFLRLLNRPDEITRLSKAGLAKAETDFLIEKNVSRFDKMLCEVMQKTEENHI